MRVFPHLRPALLWPLCFISATELYGQELATAAQTDELSAYDLYSARFSVDGKRRLSFSMSYAADTTTSIATGSSRHFASSITYTHPISDRLELSFGVGSRNQTTELAFGDDLLTSSSEHSDPAITFGGRFGLTTESDKLPELTLFANASTTSSLDDWRSEVGVSFVTTSYPAFLYGSLAANFDDWSYAGISYTAGLSLAVNDKLSIGGELSGTFSEQNTPGYLDETALLRSRVVYVVNQRWSLDASVATGLTEESPDVTFGLTVVYTF